MRHGWRCGLLLAAILAAPATASAPEPLPQPELTEPSAIGEALLDPARVEQGVVSLVARMGIGLSDNLVRGLVQMGQDDLANTNDGGLPWSFRDLHAAIQPLLPELAIEQLAGHYNAAYAAAPESLAAQLMLGRPLEPATSLTRPQIWFLLVDGFAPPPVAPKLAQAAPTQLAAAAGPGYGTASLSLTQLPSPLVGVNQLDFHHLIAILPMLAFNLPFDVQPLSTSAHEGHGGPGATVTLGAHIGAAPVPVIGPGGSVLLQPLVVNRDNRMIWWEVRDRAAMERHGAFDVASGVPVRTDLLGVARLRFTPKAEDPAGQPNQFAEAASVNARIAQWDLLSSQYDMPPILRGFVLGDRTVRGLMNVTWHDREMRIRIENTYIATMDLGFLGSGRRSGTDLVVGSLSRLADGSWEGTVTASVDMTQRLQGLGQSCPETRFVGEQPLIVRGSKVDALGGAQTIVHDQSASTGLPDGGYLALSFETAGPHTVTPTEPCLDLFDRGDGTEVFLPLNDARWTQVDGPYVIVLPSSDKLVYEDFTADATTLTGPASALPFKADSKWKIEVERP